MILAEWSKPKETDGKVHQRLQEVTGAIERAESALRQGYRAEQLYSLRVAMRRVRSMLKPVGSHRARRFRKIWGGFAAVTNRARDWDVFLLTAGELLTKAQLARFERNHAQEVRSCREAVVELVESGHWRRHLGDWKNYLNRFGAGAGGWVSLDLALGKARTALQTALRLGDDHSWHRFRITVKEVRYQAESMAGSDGTDRSAQQVIEDCKVLQSLLGSWHDSVVQLQMLEEWDETPEHLCLRQLIEERRTQPLEEIRQTVTDHPLFGPSAGE
jgi:CHAD domain-containing protein